MKAIFARSVLPIGAAASVLLAVAGCQSQKTAEPPRAGASLRAIQSAPGATKADADRAALARFIGVWNFEGWSTRDGQRTQARGVAAGAIEHEQFILIRFQADAGQLPGRAANRGGSLLLGSEPGIGVTLTVWGDASSTVNRLMGQASQGGGAFVFDEARTPADRHRLRVAIAFETDDRWSLEIRDASESDQLIVARYEFTRAAP